MRYLLLAVLLCVGCSKAAPVAKLSDDPTFKELKATIDTQQDAIRVAQKMLLTLGDSTISLAGKTEHIRLYLEERELSPHTSQHKLPCSDLFPEVRPDGKPAKARTTRDSRFD